MLEIEQEGSLDVELQVLKEKINHEYDIFF